MQRGPGGPVVAYVADVIERSERPRGVSPDRWDLLLRTAAEEFARAGYEPASLNRIIRAIGMSKSSFYRLVDSKEQLFGAVFAEFGPRLVAAIRPPSKDALREDFWGEFELLVSRLVEAGGQDPVFTQLGRMLYLAGAPTQTGPVARGGDAVAAWLGRALEVGRISGAVGDDLPADLQLQALLALARVFDEWSLLHAVAFARSGDADAQDGIQRLVRAQLAAVRRLLGPSG